MFIFQRSVQILMALITILLFFTTLGDECEANGFGSVCVCQSGRVTQNLSLRFT